MIYLDNAATSFPKAPGVAEACSHFLTKIGANAGRSSHSAARESSNIVFETRENLARLFNVKQSNRVIFCCNATEALNNAILGMVKPGDTVITSGMEHNSVLRPLKFLERDHQVKLKYIKSDQWGYPDADSFQILLQKKADHLIFTACSNVTGVIFPFLDMAQAAKKVDLNVILDASQIAGSITIDFDDSCLDVICFPGHKSLLGPTGTGGFIIAEDVEMKPLRYGGTGSRSHLEFQPQFLPDKYESGTLNIAGLAGLNAALSFLLETGLKHIQTTKAALIEQLWSGMMKIPGIDIFSPADSAVQSGVLSIVPRTMSLSQFTYELDKKNIAVRMGLQCAPIAHKTIGTYDGGGTVRFSLGYFNTQAEIDITLKTVQEIMRK